MTEEEKEERLSRIKYQLNEEDWEFFLSVIKPMKEKTNELPNKKARRHHPPTVDYVKSRAEDD
jgi:hypothetical protein